MHPDADQIVTPGFSLRQLRFVLHRRSSDYSELLHYRDRVRIYARSEYPAVLDQNVLSARSENVAGCVELAAPKNHVRHIYPADAVVSGVKNTVLNQYVVAAVQVKSVASAETCDTLRRDVPAGVDLMLEVPAVLDCVALQHQIFHIGNINSMRSAVAFLAVRVKAIRTVDK